MQTNHSFFVTLRKIQKKMKKFILPILLLTALFSSCHHHDDLSKVIPVANRTVLVYISGENTLSPYIKSELSELREGSKGIGNNHLVVYVDAADKTQMPYLIRIEEGVTVDSIAFDHDPISSDPAAMLDILTQVSTYYPGKDYGLVLWGHASGWLLEDSVSSASLSRPLRGYGIDNGKNEGVIGKGADIGAWINMNTLAKVLKTWNMPISFIFADCCQFQCIESAYELRHCAKYIIGSPAEIPGVGAPYRSITKALFYQNADFYSDIAKRYFEQIVDGCRVPISVIKCSELDNLAAATNKILHTFAASMGTNPNMSGRIYYKGSITKPIENVMYDMNDFMLHESAPGDYDDWKQAFNKCVVVQLAANKWITNNQVNFNTFTVNKTTYGGVSMYVPQQRPGSSYDKYNSDIKKTSWYQAIQAKDFNW